MRLWGVCELFHNLCISFLFWIWTLELKFLGRRDSLNTENHSLLVLFSRVFLFSCGARPPLVSTVPACRWLSSRPTPHTIPTISASYQLDHGHRIPRGLSFRLTLNQPNDSAVLHALWSPGVDRRIRLYPPFSPPRYFPGLCPSCRWWPKQLPHHQA